MINNIYRDYETFKKIIIDKKINLWVITMKLIFETLKIKHENITSYHSRINETIKKFNDVLDHILTKYCIDELIKNWNFYLNQIAFVTRIRIHIIINFFFILSKFELAWRCRKFDFKSLWRKNWLNFVFRSWQNWNIQKDHDTNYEK